MQKKQGYFYFIPSLLAESGEPTKSLLFGLIASLSNREGFCWASNKYLAGKLKLKSVTQIKTYLKELAKEGWVKVEIIDNSRRKVKPLFNKAVNLLTGGSQCIDEGQSIDCLPSISSKTSSKTSSKETPFPITPKTTNGGSNGRLREDVETFWRYFLLKTKKAFKWTEDKRRLIEKRLGEYPVGDLKKCVDAFAADDWPGRKERMNLIYCIGHQKGKPDNVEKWLNKSVKRAIKYE